jgi:O-antigen/teichoic acid export membrane protein
LDKAGEIENGTFGSIFIASTLILLAAFSFDQFVDAGRLVIPVQLIRLMALATVIGLFTLFFQNRCAAHQNFKLVGQIETFRAVSNCFFLVFCTLMWGILGTVFGLIVSDLMICLFARFLSYRYCGRLRAVFSPQLLWNLVRIGLPITIFWWIFILQTTVDRIVSITFLGKTATGYYGLSVALVSTIMLLPQVVSRVLYPKINMEVGANSSNDELFRLVIMPTRALSLILPLALGLLLIVSPVIYTQLLPKYLPGLACAQILIFFSFFRLTLANGANFLIATNRQKLLLSFVIISLVSGCTASILTIKAGFNINGIAVSTGLAGALLALLMWKTVFRDMGYNTRQQWKEILLLYAPFLTLLPLLVILLIFPINAGNNIKIIFSNMITFIILFCLLIYWVPPFNRWARELLLLVNKDVFRNSLKKI